jgi:precorrin-2 dehydrogenase/sirohydrochlorin ferrochelatase
MLPLMVDVTSLPVAIVGNGDSALARLRLVEEHGARDVTVYAEDAKSELASAAGPRLIPRWPTSEDLAVARLVFVADAPQPVVEAARAAAAKSALVHVQDQIPLCDFHLPARLRRGRLLVTVSTDGAAAGLSRLLRDYLADRVFGPEWAGRVEEVAAERRRQKGEGLGMGALFEAISSFVAKRGWLAPRA